MDLREEGFWDSHYQLELSNYEEDGDEGEVWFGKRLSIRIVEWLLDRLVLHLNQGNLPKLIDIGCGNGFLLVKLLETLSPKVRADSFTLLSSKKGMIGIDYSEKSITLSGRIASARGFEKYLNLRQCDFLDSHHLNEIVKHETLDYIVDIGTYDAICLLASENEEKLKEVKLRYIQSLKILLRKGSIMIFASCNHTKEEIFELFKLDIEVNFRLIDEIETPKLKFGGKEGSQVTCMILEFN